MVIRFSTGNKPVVTQNFLPSTSHALPPLGSTFLIDTNDVSYRIVNTVLFNRSRINY